MPKLRGLVLAAGLVTTLEIACPRAAAADEPAPPPPPPVAAAPSAAPPPASAPAALKPATARGAIVVAVGDDAGAAARALAREAYADETLRPAIDDATARVLAGEPAPAAGPAKLNEIADVRKAAQSAGSEVVARRLLASLGADLGAALVIPVTLRDGQPVARVLSVAKGTFEPIALTGTLEPQADGSSRVKWNGVAALLAGVAPKQPAAPLAPASASAAKGPLAPKKEEPSRSIFSSPWTWVGVGAVVTVGVVILVVTQSQGDPAGLRLQGRVAP